MEQIDEIQNLKFHRKELHLSLGKIKIERKHINLMESIIRFYFMFFASIILIIFSLFPAIGIKSNLNEAIFIATALMAVVFGMLAFDSSRKIKVEKEKKKRLDLLELEVTTLLDEADLILTQEIN
jgi:Ca2+/Na+ antiporter